MDIRKLFGANVRRRRLALGLSQEALAARMGADRAYVSLIERGEQNATLLTVHALAEAFGIAPDRLLAMPEQEEAPPGRSRAEPGD